MQGSDALMAKFKAELPNDIIKQFDSLEKNTEEMLGEMTRAGAKVVLEKMKASAPIDLQGKIKTTVTYKTPSDGGINTKVYVSGYIPFSNPNRKYFSRRNKQGGGGKMYSTSLGVPAEFLAILYEYGRSTSPFPKKPFMRKAFRGKDIEKAMTTIQEAYFKRIFK